MIWKHYGNTQIILFQHYYSVHSNPHLPVVSRIYSIVQYKYNICILGVEFISLLSSKYSSVVSSKKKKNLT